MQKFSTSLSDDLILECKAGILNNDIDISKLMVYIN